MDELAASDVKHYEGDTAVSRWWSFHLNYSFSSSSSRHEEVTVRCRECVCVRVCVYVWWWCRVVEVSILPPVAYAMSSSLLKIMHTAHPYRLRLGRIIVDRNLEGFINRLRRITANFIK